MVRVSSIAIVMYVYDEPYCQDDYNSTVVCILVDGTRGISALMCDLTTLTLTAAVGHYHHPVQ